MTTNNAQIFSGLPKLPGKTKANRVYRLKSVSVKRLRSKQTQLLMNGSSNEYAWLAYDWMKRMSCFAARVVGLIRLEFAVDVE